MKKLTLLSTAVCMLVAAIVFTTSSCKKEDLERTLKMKQQTVMFQTNAHPADGNELILMDSTLSSELAETMSDNGISMDKITSVKLSSLKLRIADNSIAEGITFDPFSYANAHIKAGSLTQQQLAFKTEIPNTGLTEIAFESQANELVEFLKQDNINILVKAYNESDVPATSYVLDIEYDVVYNVTK